MVADVAASDAAKQQKRLQKKARKDGVSAHAGKTDLMHASAVAL